MKKQDFYSGDEARLLERISRTIGVSAADVVELIEVELAFHSMGKRRGLFPALRTVVERSIGPTSSNDEASHPSS